MGAAALALIIANSPFADVYFEALHAYLGPLSVQHWINDALMAVFFLLVGLEIKREMIDGQLSTWSRRTLPGIAASGGMIVPALIYVAFNWDDTEKVQGWAIPTATDIAFALGVLSLLGSRVPTSLKVFLAALAIIDDLGAVLIIAIFYTGDISVTYLGAAAIVLAALVAMNQFGVLQLWPYLVLGMLLWFLVLGSGIHATVAGVLLALTIPLRASRGRPDEMAGSPLHRLEHKLQGWVAFGIVPIFGFANAGVSFEGLTINSLLDPLTLGVALGLLIGKVAGVFGSAYAVIRAGFADVPMGAGFIGLLAFANDPLIQEEVKLGILLGSTLSGLGGWTLLRFAPRQVPSPQSTPAR